MNEDDIDSSFETQYGMRKIWLLIGIFPWVSQAEVGAPTQEIAGVVRIMRGGSYTEVFFKDLKDSVVISFDSNHNKIFEACDESRKKGKPVQLVIDPKNRRVLSVAPEKSESKNQLGSIESNEESLKSVEKNSEFKPIESDANPSSNSSGSQ